MHHPYVSADIRQGMQIQLTGNLAQRTLRVSMNRREALWLKL